MKLNILVAILSVGVSGCFAGSTDEPALEHLVIDPDDSNGLEDGAEAAYKSGECLADCLNGTTVGWDDCTGHCDRRDQESSTPYITQVIGSCYPDMFPHGRYRVDEVGGGGGYATCNGQTVSCPEPEIQTVPYTWSANYGVPDPFPGTRETYHHASSSYPFTLTATSKDGRTTRRSFTPNGPGSCEVLGFIATESIGTEGLQPPLNPPWDVCEEFPGCVCLAGTRCKSVQNNCSCSQDGGDHGSDCICLAP